ncbi:MAG TPA: VOC family protein [Streptosporangiaceae bacterium]|jgi:uncharacterized glyoxalase superfamily protein PhnB
MSEDRSVSSQVEVTVDPQTAFAAFTEEMNLWWVRGPVNFFDAARAVAMACEPGVGGRLLEVYDEASGEALELGRITVWQPGERLAWQSSVDEVRTDVRFEPTGAGTIVRVVATIPAGTQDKGGTSWVRVIPPWFAAWCARRSSAPRVAADLDRLALVVCYRKPVAAARWLATAFGFEQPRPLPEDARDGEGAHTWIEFRIGDCSLMIYPLDGELPDGAADTHVPWIYVDDLDAHLARAQAAGAGIVEGIHQYGYRAYSARDPEGRHWTFLQARPTMTAPR